MVRPSTTSPVFAMTVVVRSHVAQEKPGTWAPAPPCFPRTPTRRWCLVARSPHGFVAFGRQTSGTSRSPPQPPQNSTWRPFGRDRDRFAEPVEARRRVAGTGSPIFTTVSSTIACCRVVRGRYRLVASARCHTGEYRVLAASARGAVEPTASHQSGILSKELAISSIGAVSPIAAKSR